MFRRKVSNSQLLDNAINENSKLKDAMCKQEKQLKELQNFIDFLNLQVCDGRQICGIKKIQYRGSDTYVGYILAHKYEIEPQTTYTYDILGYLSINPQSPIYRAELNWQMSRRETDIVKKLEISKHYVCDKDLYNLGIGTTGINIIKELARQLNCSEIYGHRRPLDGTDAELVKFYDKTGFKQAEDSDMIRYQL